MGVAAPHETDTSAADEAGAPLDDDPAEGRPAYRAAVNAIRNRDEGGSWLFLVGFSILVVVLNPEPKPADLVAIVVGALLLEGSSWVAMRLLGVPRAAFLLLPPLRRRLPADSAQIEPWKRGLAALIGPLPCVALAFWLAIVHAVAGVQVAGAGLIVGIIGALQLLPFVPFGGGEIMNLTLFSRSPTLETAFRVGTAVAGAALFALAGLYFLAGLCAIQLLSARRTHRLAKEAAAIRARFPPLPPLKTLGDDVLCALYDGADRLVVDDHRNKTHQGRTDFAGAYADVMSQLHAHAVMRPPSWGACIGLWAAYGAACVAVVIALASAAVASNPSGPPPAAEPSEPQAMGTPS